LRRLAVFDVDGTLLDSRNAISEAIGAAFTTLGLAAPPYEQTRRVVGLSLTEAMRTLAPDISEPHLDTLTEAYKQAFVRQREEGRLEALYAGAREALSELKGQGWLIGIATGKARRGVEKFLEHHGFAEAFDAAFCADDGPGKPDPHMLRLNMDALGVDAARTVMIGDTSFDMAMARAAGAHALGVAWGFHTRDEIEAGGAHHIVEDFEGLRAYFSDWRGAHFLSQSQAQQQQ